MAAPRPADEPVGLTAAPKPTILRHYDFVIYAAPDGEGSLCLCLRAKYASEWSSMAISASPSLTFGATACASASPPLQKHESIGRKSTDAALRDKATSKRRHPEKQPYDANADGSTVALVAASRFL